MVPHAMYVCHISPQTLSSNSMRECIKAQLLAVSIKRARIMQPFLLLLIAASISIPLVYCRPEDSASQQDSSKTSDRKPRFCDQGEKGCCLHEFSRAARDLSINIIQPARIQMNYCDGHCDHTLSSYEQALMGLVPVSSCCRATESIDVQLLYAVNDTVMTHWLPKRTVTRCGCS
ncbi:uncharacterized protein [Watersipora subatra]|uniref:uncharacterized protein isoform X2 n=1 Tax=Watersipora subatra TaxID=2589382 RepID=UPI00355B4F9A